jgi:hypothetical protein
MAKWAWAELNNNVQQLDNKCPICPIVVQGKEVRATASDKVVTINKPVDCQTRNSIYCISCSKCAQQYIGETDRTLQARFFDHRGYVVNKMLKKATGNHSFRHAGDHIGKNTQ